MQESVGKRLRAARQARGLSQRTFAARLGVTQGAVSQMELELIDVYAMRVRDAAQILNVDGNYLLGLCDTMERKN